MATRDRPTQEQVTVRRQKVVFFLMSHIEDAGSIAHELGCDRHDIYNDIKYIKRQVGPWLTQLGQTGYAYDVKMGIDKLKLLETQMEEMKEKADTPELKLSIMKEIRETIISRLTVEGEGPTLLALRQATQKDDKV